MPDMTPSINKTSPSGIARYIVKLPEQEQQQKLSYQTNKLSQYVELQLSDLQNTLHYIQKKHSMNQIKESISHAYSIFSETQPVFRQLRIVFIYDKIKKLVNCFSIIYLILMEHIEKPTKIFIDSDPLKNNLDLIDRPNQDYEDGALTRRTQKGKNNPSKNNEPQTTSNGTKKPKALGGVHLYNQQYNRYIQSDLDRLKRKLKEQAKELQENNPKVSEKDKLKEQIFKEINTDIYGSPSPDQLTLFFNLNSNRYGSDLQYVTFQDQLQQIAAFFKQSQDEALEFLNKSRDDFMFLNFNQGFKETINQYKVEKQEQVNGFVSKVKNLFEAIKNKTVVRQNQINHQITQLKKIEKRITKPISFEMETQTSCNFQDQILKLKKKIEQVESNYKELQNYHSKENQNDSKNMTFLEHKIAFKEHQISILKKQLDDKSHFIDFLNDKINNGTDPKVLRKISNIYRSHSKKNSSKIKVQLEQLQKQVAVQLIGLKRKGSLGSSEEDYQNLKRQVSEKQNEEPQEKVKQQEKKSLGLGFEEYEKPSKKKRKQGMSFFASPQKRFTSYVERNASFNFQNGRIEQEKSQLQQVSSGDMNLYEEQQYAKNQILGPQQLSAKRDNQPKNFVKPGQRKSQDRNSLQVMQKSKSKNFEPKRSAFASGIGNNKMMQSSPSKFGTDKRTSSVSRQNISEETIMQSLEEQKLMRQINGMGNLNNEDFTDGQNQNYYDPGQQDMQFDSENMNYDEIDEDRQNWDVSVKKKQYSLGKNGTKFQIGQSVKSKMTDWAQNLDSNTNSRFNNERQSNDSLLKSASHQTEGNKASFKRKQNEIQSMSNRQNKSNKSKNLLGKNPQTSIRKQNINSSSLNQNGLATSLQQRQRSLLNDQQGQAGQQFEEYKIKKRRNKFQNQGVVEKQDDINSEFNDDDQASDGSDDGITKFFKTVSGDSNYDDLSAQQKDNMISTYFTTIYKDKKMKSSILCSRLVDIFISRDQAKPHRTQTHKNNKNSLSVSESNKEKNKINTASPKSRISKIQDLKDKTKNFSSGNLNELKKQKGKPSEFQTPDSLMKVRENHRMSQNIHLLSTNLNTFKDITITPEVKEQQDPTQRQAKQPTEQSSEPKQSSTDKKSQNSSDYERIYGISLNSWNKKKRDNTDLSQLSQQDKQKMEDYLEKAAMKAAIKSKNVDEFKAKIKKMHISKCGEHCKHLERYLQNFNKYRSCNREIMKIHIENVSNLIPNESMVKSNKQNSVTLPSINVLGAADSSKGFGSIQRNFGVVNRK